MSDEALDLELVSFPDAPADLIGAATAAFHGAWSDAAELGTPVPSWS